MGLRRLMALAVFAAGLAACGGGDDESATTQGSGTQTAAGGATTAGSPPPPVRVTVQRNVVLRVGDKGPRVRRLQVALAALGLDPGKPDGVFGEATRRAVTIFQRRNDLEADGVVGVRTARAINQALAALG
jgi:peptidoglycan hydrolase-like protein with peptidoglycan-binding domain